VKKGIFGYQHSPYLPLLKLARCELGDIRRMVRDDGLERTLVALRRAGVYITFEEFKGRAPIVREGQVIPVREHGFDNPYLSSYYHSRSGGSTSAGTRVAIDLDHLAAMSPNIMLSSKVHGVLEAPKVVWHAILPSGAGINAVLLHARHGQIPIKWFSPVASGDLRSSLFYRLATGGIVALGRLFGEPIPKPELVRLDHAGIIAHGVSTILAEHGTCLIRSPVSLAMRACLAAKEEGLDLSGAVFSISGEPPTPAKVRAITSSGASFVSTYFFAECGAVGIGCVKPADENDLHFLSDALALIQHPRTIPGTDVKVDAFHFTTLLPTAPKIMLNVEIDDYGVVEKRSCGCPLESIGYDVHIRHIRSFAKLTGEGVTLVGSEMVRILEEVLPDRFGGSPLDYQLLEEEDADGFTRMSILVDPRIDIPDEEAVIEKVLEALRHGSVAAEMAGTHWQQAGIFRIRRMAPVWTDRGKLMPLVSRHHIDEGGR
jgi:hypothetical protein